MMIWRYKPEGCTNFGDALNDYLWPRLFSQDFQQRPGYFYGIGTVLGKKMPEQGPHIIFGAGLGYNGIPTPTSDWDIRFVRGPLTSRLLGECPWITDPGILVRAYFTRNETPSIECAFMPRWDSISPALIEGCAKAGIHLLDPREPVETILETICDTHLLLTEALHGAVCADALRTPWISIYGSRGHEFKWKDWVASLGMIWNPIDATQFTLSWARDFAVPQLSALSVHTDRFTRICTEVERYA